MSAKTVLFFIIIAITAISCASQEYKGDIQKITNVPRETIIREQKLLTQRINLWARSLDDLMRNSTTANPLGEDNALALRTKIDQAKSVLKMLKEKLTQTPLAITFTRKEWGEAIQANCKIDRIPIYKTTDR